MRYLHLRSKKERWDIIPLSCYKWIWLAGCAIRRLTQEESRSHIQFEASLDYTHSEILSHTHKKIITCIYLLVFSWHWQNTTQQQFKQSRRVVLGHRVCRNEGMEAGRRGGVSNRILQEVERGVPVGGSFSCLSLPFASTRNGGTHMPSRPSLSIKHFWKNPSCYPRGLPSGWF